jgi:ethanolamine utilization protein EutP
MKRIMVLGPTGAGKTSLLHALGIKQGKVRKTQTLNFESRSLDTPGEYMDMPAMYHVLICASAKASLILFLSDPTRKCAFPDNFVNSLRAPVIGIISKADITSPEEKETARASLTKAGVKEFMQVSSVTGTGIKELLERIDSISVPE